MEGEMVTVLIKTCEHKLAFTLSKLAHVVKIQITHECGSSCVLCSAKPECWVNCLLVYFN